MIQWVGVSLVNLLTNVCENGDVSTNDHHSTTALDEFDSPWYWFGGDALDSDVVHSLFFFYLVVSCCFGIYTYNGIISVSG